MVTATTPQVRNDVSDFVRKPRKMLIGGKWVESVSGKTFETYNPATGEVLAHVAEGEQQDIDLAVKAARKAFESGPWPAMSPSERGRLLWKLAELIDQNRDEAGDHAGEDQVKNNVMPVGHFKHQYHRCKRRACNAG